MNLRYTTLITASMLAVAGTAVSGQSQTRPQSQTQTQSQPQTQRQAHTSAQSIQIAERLSAVQSGLYRAIAIAETYANGVAIGVRLAADQPLVTRQDRMDLDSRASGGSSDRGGAERIDSDRDSQTDIQRRSDEDRERQADDQQRRYEDRERQTDRQQLRPEDQDRRADQRQEQRTNWRDAPSSPLFAVVTCVVDGTHVRDVVIDMATNTVIGVHATEHRGSEQADLRWDSGDERYYSRDQAPSTDTVALYRASELMGATVRGAAGETLGEFDDLAIDPETNRVVYGVLRRGGLLGMGESRHAIPSSELTPPRSGRIVLGLSENHFENTSGFDNSSWPTKAETRLIRDGSVQAAAAPSATRIVKASDIIGRNVECSDGNGLGEVTDLIIEPRTGRVVYAVVKSDRGHMPVPMSSLTKSGDNYVLPMRMDELRSMPTLDVNSDPNWNDDSWNRRIHDSYGAKYETFSVSDGR